MSTQRQLVVLLSMAYECNIHAPRAHGPVGRASHCECPPGTLTYLADTQRRVIINVITEIAVCAPRGNLVLYIHDFLRSYKA